MLRISVDLRRSALDAGLHRATALAARCASYSRPAITVRALFYSRGIRMSWQGNRGTRHERGYDYKWVKLRESILKRDLHLCQSCLTLGIPKTAKEVDHIIPKVQGGTDEPTNLRSLCSPCHLEKSKREKPKQASKRLTRNDGWGETELKWFGYSIPKGVKHSAIPVVLVCGPPAAGKTTHIANHAKLGDMVIDFDQYLNRIGGKKWDTDQNKVKLAFSLRDADIRSLQYRESGTAWLIAMAPTAKERETWADALGPKLSVVMLDTPEAECITRVEADSTRAHAAKTMREVIRQWWADYD